MLLPLLPSDYRHKLSAILPTDILEVLLDYPTLMSKLSELEEKNVKKIANLFSSVLLAEENASYLNDELPSKAQLTELAEMLENRELSSTAAKEVFLRFFDKEMHYKSTKEIAKELNVLQENDSAALEAIVDEVLSNPATKQAQADYKAGQEKVLGFLVGQVMQASKGKANPSAAQEILKKKLA